MKTAFPTVALLASLAASNAHAARDPFPSAVLDEAWTEQKVTAIEGTAYMDYGSAAVVRKSSAVIGARGENERTGAAYVLKKSGTQWIQAQKITADDGLVGDEYGYRIVLDDTSLIVTAFNATVDGIPFQGAAYAYVYDAGAWRQAQKLTAVDGAVFDDFGSSIALDADSAIIGAFGADLKGAAYAFERSGDTWTQAQKLSADDGVSYDNFGVSAALSGTTAFVGANNAAIDGGLAQGAVYVFVNVGGQWSQVQKLTASDGQAGDNFGMSVAFDGTTLLVGAPPARTTRGVVYAFTESDGRWVELQTLSPDDGMNGDYFGEEIAMKDSGAVIAAETARIDGDSRGVAYRFESVDGTWIQRHKFIASDGSTGDFFGFAIGYDGSTAVITAPSSDIDGNQSQGAAYFYTRETVFADGFESAAP